MSMQIVQQCSQQAAERFVDLLRETKTTDEF